MEPVWANDGIFTINTFDGTRWIRDVDFTLEAHVHNAIASNPDTKLWFDVNVPAANKSSSGLWLPHGSREPVLRARAITGLDSPGSD